MARMFTRRRILGVLLSTGVLAGAGVYSLSFSVPAPGATVLSPEEITIVRAIAEAWFPRGRFPIGGIDAGVAEAVDQGVADMLDGVRLAGFRYVLRTLEWGTFASRGVRFSQLAISDRLAVLETWADPSVLPRRVAVDSLKAVLGMAYFAHPDVVRAIGWRTGCDDAGI